MSRARLGFDIGGSGVRGARWQDGALGPVSRAPLSGRGVDDVIEAIAALAGEIGPGLDLGLGVPGFVHDGVVLGAPNLPSLDGVALARRVGERLGVAVAMDNDANCAALGCRAARGGGDDLVLLTLGTGVGGGVISGGRLLRGAGGTGAEVGHIYAGGERRCGCGGVGCLEMSVGTVGMRAAARELGVDVPDGEAILDAARAGQGWACTVVDGAALALGRGLVTLINLFNPADVVLTGGLAHAEDLLAPGALAYLRAHGVRPSVARARITWEGRADAYAIVGAAALLDAGGPAA